MKRIITLGIAITSLILAAQAHAGAVQCRGDSNWEYVKIGEMNDGTPLYEVYCKSYPNPSWSSSGPGGVPIGYNINTKRYEMIPQCFPEIELTKWV